MCRLQRQCYLPPCLRNVDTTIFWACCSCRARLVPLASQKVPYTRIGFLPCPSNTEASFATALGVLGPLSRLTSDLSHVRLCECGYCGKRRTWCGKAFDSVYCASIRSETFSPPPFSTALLHDRVRSMSNRPRGWRAVGGAVRRGGKVTRRCGINKVKPWIVPSHMH